MSNREGSNREGIRLYQPGATSKQNAPDFDTLFPQIMPLLAPAAKFSTSEFAASIQENGHFISQPWLSQLAIYYVVEAADSYRFVTQNEFDLWPINSEELQAIALDNLDSTVEQSLATPLEDTPYSKSGVARHKSPAGVTVLTPCVANAFNATFLLSQLFRDSLSRELGNEWFISIPCRDLWVATSSNLLQHHEMRQTFSRSIAGYHQQWPHPLENRLFLVTRDGISLWVDEAISDRAAVA